METSNTCREGKMGKKADQYHGTTERRETNAGKGKVGDARLGVDLLLRLQEHGLDIRTHKPRWGWSVDRSSNKDRQR